jgi:hypothetical protein
MINNWRIAIFRGDLLIRIAMRQIAGRFAVTSPIRRKRIDRQLQHRQANNDLSVAIDDGLTLKVANGGNRQFGCSLI